MTEFEKQRAERDANDDAKEIGLLLLLAFSKRSGAQNVSFSAGRFIINGRAITARSIINYLEKITDRHAKRLTRITRQLDAGEITLSEWKREFDRTITAGHILKAALALGGIGAAIRNPTVIDAIDAQLAYHDKFTEDIRTGNAGPFAAILRRARLYNQSPHILFTDLQMELVKRTGVRTEARNILRPAEHCSTQGGVIGCPELTTLSWMPVGEMVKIGDRRCGKWCRCYLEFR